MFGGVVFAITGPRVAGGRDKSAPGLVGRPASAPGQGRRRFVHQPHGGPLPASFRRVSATRLRTRGSRSAAPFLFAPDASARSRRRAALSRCMLAVAPTSPHRPLTWPFVARQRCLLTAARMDAIRGGASGGGCAEIRPSEWSKVGDCGVLWRLTERRLRGLGLAGGRCAQHVSRHLHAQARRQGAADTARQVPRRTGRRVDGRQKQRPQPGCLPARGIPAAGPTWLWKHAKTNPERRAELRVFAAGADEQHPDAQGRITLSSDLRRYAGLSKECVVIGSVDYLEIWDAQAWHDYQGHPRRELLRGRR